MEKILTDFLNEVKILNGWEITAVICGITYTVLAAFQNRFCWFFGGISTLIYIFIFFQNKLYLNSGLNFYYTFIAILGWINWSKLEKEEPDSLKVFRAPFRTKIIHFFLIIVLCLGTGFLFDEFTDHKMPYIDALASALSVTAAWFASRKYIENWIIYIVADVIALYMFAEMKLYFTCLLFLIYIGNAFYARYLWAKSLKNAGI